MNECCVLSQLCLHLCHYSPPPCLLAPRPHPLTLGQDQATPGGECKGGTAPTADLGRQPATRTGRQHGLKKGSWLMPVVSWWQWAKHPMQVVGRAVVMELGQPAQLPAWAVAASSAFFRATRSCCETLCMAARWWAVVPFRHTEHERNEVVGVQWSSS
jgi:hypothetical protein